MSGWGGLALLLVGFFALEPLGVPVSLVDAVAALILYSVARRGRVIDTARVLRNAPWQMIYRKALAAVKLSELIANAVPIARMRYVV